MNKTRLERILPSLDYMIIDNYDDMTAFRLADMIGAFQFVLDTPKCYGKSPNGQQRTDTTGVPPQLSF